MTYEVKSLNEECGVFGIWGHPDAAKLTFQLSMVIGEDPCPLLTTVLKTVEPKIGHFSSIRMSPDTENTTFFIKGD